jgi:hypothetical protein
MWEARDLASLFAMPDCETSASLAIARSILARDTAARKECAEIAREAQRMRERLFSENEASINAHRAMQAMEIADSIEATITGGGDE